MASELFREAYGSVRGRVAGLGIGLIGFNVVAWGWALVAFRHHPLLIGTSLLAYSFGLRHAVDADHIAAIDNVTRKLMQDGKRPVATGLYFSLGHSTVVVLLSLAVVFASISLQGQFVDLKKIAGLVSTGVSALFLFAIAFVNMKIWASSWRSFNAVRNGNAGDAGDYILSGGGLMARVNRRLFRLIGKSWHMYWLGLLFGLGFETASEVGLLGISATGVTSGLSPWAILVFPALFSAGMALVDTTDGVLMLGAYGWAFVKPVRKLYYNLIITAMSVVIALVVSGVETLGLIDGEFRLGGAFWRLVESVNDNFGLLGYGIIGLFAFGWVASLVIYKLKRYDEIEVT